MATRTTGTTTTEITEEELKQAIMGLFPADVPAYFLAPGEVLHGLGSSGISCSLKEVNGAMLALVRERTLDTLMTHGNSRLGGVEVRFVRTEPELDDSLIDIPERQH